MILEHLNDRTIVAIMFFFFGLVIGLMIGIIVGNLGAVC